MNGQEHYAEAERLLEEARIPYVVTMPASSSMADVQRVKDVLTEKGLDNGIVAAEPIRVDVTPTLLAAQVHATLALAAAQEVR